MPGIVYFNDKFINEKEAKVPINTHALHYGTGVFEGIRAYYNEKQNALLLFRMEDHYKRMINSAKVVYINIPYSLKELREITTELIRKNFAKQDLYIRPLAYKKDRAVGNFNLLKVADGFFMYTVSLGRHLDTQKGVRALVSSWERISEKAIPPQAKITGSYINTCLAKTESAEKGFDEALFLNYKGCVVEGSAENIFVVRHGAVATPPVSDGILEGITRDTLIKIFKNYLGITVKEKSIKQSDVFSADEILLVGTGAEISGIIRINNKCIGKGTIGHFTKKIQEIYNKIVHGEDERYSGWITRVTGR